MSVLRWLRDEMFRPIEPWVLLGLVLIGGFGMSSCVQMVARDRQVEDLACWNQGGELRYFRGQGTICIQRGVVIEEVR